VKKPPSHKRAAADRDPAEQEKLNQEVLRANRELAAYFKGRRTEREARAALKIIKAFVRDRERADPARRRPLPGKARGQAAASLSQRHSQPAERRSRRRAAGGRAQDADSKRAAMLESPPVMSNAPFAADAGSEPESPGSGS
jgi:hypothetical protein